MGSIGVVERCRVEWDRCVFQNIWIGATQISFSLDDDIIRQNRKRLKDLRFETGNLTSERVQADHFMNHVRRDMDFIKIALTACNDRHGGIVECRRITCCGATHHRQVMIDRRDNRIIGENG